MCESHDTHRAQSRVNHVQHIERLSRATCRITYHAVRRNRSAIKLNNRIYFSFISLTEPLTDEGGEDTGVPRENPGEKRQKMPVLTVGDGRHGDLPQDGGGRSSSRRAAPAAQDAVLVHLAAAAAADVGRADVAVEGQRRGELHDGDVVGEAGGIAVVLGVHGELCDGAGHLVIVHLGHIVSPRLDPQVAGRGPVQTGGGCDHRVLVVDDAAADVVILEERLNLQGADVGVVAVRGHLAVDDEGVRLRVLGQADGGDDSHGEKKDGRHGGGGGGGGVVEQVAVAARS